jgi:hypothetical protein
MQLGVSRWASLMLTVTNEPSYSELSGPGVPEPSRAEPEIDAPQDDAGRRAFELLSEKFASSLFLDPVTQPHKLRLALLGRGSELFIVSVPLDWLIDWREGQWSKQSLCCTQR